MPADLFPVDEPAISLNDHPKRVPFWRRWLRSRLRLVPATTRKPIHVDWWGLGQALGAAGYSFGAVTYFGLGLGLFIAGASLFVGATVIESLGG